MQSNFSLYSFDQASAVQFSSSIVRSTTNLLISYQLCGDVEKIRLPEQATMPLRRHNLWQTTCFEFFLALADLPGYWEINLSPSGDWNVYAFAGYRTGMREEPAFAALPFTTERRAKSFLLELTFPLTQLIRPEQALSLGISAVLQESSGQRSFWALTHCGPQPDFHRRESFIVHL